MARAPALFGCAPLGRGTVLVESLTGFFARLCVARSLWASEVARHLIAPRCPDGVFPRHAGAIGQFLSSHCARVDARRESALPFAAALEALTWQAEYASLTFAPWYARFDAEALRIGLGRRKRWCASCLGEWSARSAPAYEPLLWRFEVVSHCPAHGVGLVDRCAHCGRTQPLVTQGVPIGMCVRCGHRLEGEASAEALNEACLDAHPRWSLWRSVAFSRLLAHSSAPGVGAALLAGPSCSRGLHRLLSHAIAHPPGSVNARLGLAQALGVTVSHFYRVVEGSSRFSVMPFLDACMQLGVAPLRVLLDEYEEGERSWPDGERSLSRCDPWTLALEARESASAKRWPERAAVLDRFISNESRCDVYNLGEENSTTASILEKHFPLRMHSARDAANARTEKRRREREVRCAAAVDAALAAGGEQSLSDAARAAGEKSVSTLKRRCPQRYARLTELLKERSDPALPALRARCRRALEAALGADGGPTLHAVAQSLGRRAWRVCDLCPTEAEALVALRREEREARRARIRAAVEAEARRKRPREVATLARALGEPRDMLKRCAPQAYAELVRAAKARRAAASERGRERLAAASRREAMASEHVRVSSAVAREAEKERPRAVGELARALGVPVNYIKHVCSSEYRALELALGESTERTRAALLERSARALKEQIGAESPCSFSSIASAMGVAHERLQEALPELVSELEAARERARARRQAERARPLVELLERALEEVPPPNVAQICKRHSVTRFVLKSASDELYAALVGAHREARAGALVAERARLTEALEREAAKIAPRSGRCLARALGTTVSKLRSASEYGYITLIETRRFRRSSSGALFSLQDL